MEAKREIVNVDDAPFFIQNKRVLWMSLFS